MKLSSLRLPLAALALSAPWLAWGQAAPQVKEECQNGRTSYLNKKLMTSWYGSNHYGPMKFTKPGIGKSKIASCL